LTLELSPQITVQLIDLLRKTKEKNNTKSSVNYHSLVLSTWGFVRNAILCKMQFSFLLVLRRHPIRH